MFSSHLLEKARRSAAEIERAEGDSRNLRYGEANSLRRVVGATASGSPQLIAGARQARPPSPARNKECFPSKLPGIVVMFQGHVMPGVFVDARRGFFQRVGLERQGARESPRLLENLGVFCGPLVLNRVSHAPQPFRDVQFPAVK